MPVRCTVGVDCGRRTGCSGSGSPCTCPPAPSYPLLPAALCCPGATHPASVRDLAPPGELATQASLPFEFGAVEMQYESYRGSQVGGGGTGGSAGIAACSSYKVLYKCTAQACHALLTAAPPAPCCCPLFSAAAPGARCPPAGPGALPAAGDGCAGHGAERGEGPRLLGAQQPTAAAPGAAHQGETASKA